MAAFLGLIGQKLAELGAGAASGGGGAAAGGAAAGAAGAMGAGAGAPVAAAGPGTGAMMGQELMKQAGQGPAPASQGQSRPGIDPYTPTHVAQGFPPAPMPMDGLSPAGAVAPQRSPFDPEARRPRAYGGSGA